MEAVLLTLQEAADLENSKLNSIHKKIQRNKLSAVKIATEERCGFEYRVALEDLSTKAQRKYYARLKAAGAPKEREDVLDKLLPEAKDLTQSQRDDIDFWKDVIVDWRTRMKLEPGRMTEATTEFVAAHNLKHPDKPLTERTLFYKWQQWRELGDIALADMRQSRRDKGSSRIDEILWHTFLTWWLDENRPSATTVYRATEAWAQMHVPELLPIPSMESFRRALKQVPRPVVWYFREGHKEYDDHCAAYVKRVYDYIDSNDIWSADFHTLDMMVRCDRTGKVYRPHVLVWNDVRSRRALSVRLSESSNSDTVILAFRDAVQAFGLPREVYLDNGREFLVSDFGGRGKRKTDIDSDYGSTILQRCGVTMINAKVANAKAKVIERSFKELCSNFSKLFMTYCGNRPENRPERHGKVLKETKNIPLVSEIEEELKLYLEGIYNLTSSKAAGLNGKSPDEAYRENLVTKRMATEDQLMQLLARSERLQSVDRNGVFVRFGSEKVYFYDSDLALHYMGEKVYVRFDPNDLSEVFVLDSQERLIARATPIETGGYDQAKDKDAIKAIASKNKKLKKFVQSFKENLPVAPPEMREVMRQAAIRNIEANSRPYRAEVLEPVRIPETMAQAVGDDSELVDFNTMIENARKARDRKGD